MTPTDRNSRRRQFGRQLKAVVRPELSARGFAFDGKRTFRRLVERGDWNAIQIVEFQLGIKRLAGRFTVNIGVFSQRFVPSDWPPPGDAPATFNCLPAMWRRLGDFYDPPRSRLASILGRPKPERGDYWWEQDADAETMAENFQPVLACLITGALPWLDLLTCPEAFEWATSELARARRWKAALGTLGADPRFELRYYSEIVRDR